MALIMLEFKTLASVSSGEFQEVLKIYTEAFPAKERIPTEILIQKLQNNSVQMWMAIFHGSVIAMALVYPFKSCDLTLLAYFATDKNFRGQGTGTQMINFLLSRYSILVLEVEDPEFGDNLEQRQRRINYYRRLGAKEFKNVRYVLPALCGDIPTEMRLMMLSALPQVIMAGNMVKLMIEDLYLNLYNQPKNNLLLQELINQFIPKKVELI